MESCFFVFFFSFIFGRWVILRSASGSLGHFLTQATRPGMLRSGPAGLKDDLFVCVDVHGIGKQQ